MLYVCVGKRGRLSWSTSSFGQMLETIGVGLGGKESITLGELATAAASCYT